MDPTVAQVVAAVVGIVVGLVIGRLTAPQRAAAIHWAPLVRSLVRRLAARNPGRDYVDVAAEVVDLVCEELGVPETEQVRSVATATAQLETLTKAAGKGAPD